uniref:Uncharacterized protein n=1 Tax=Vespula pensylvanica TaxID=30213 RepID=A0A834JPN5_VESPE|nr:hypothetical protein H0235_017776 [Vespula pensylvanica]
MFDWKGRRQKIDRRTVIYGKEIAKGGPPVLYLRSLFPIREVINILIRLPFVCGRIEKGGSKDKPHQYTEHEIPLEEEKKLLCRLTSGEGQVPYIMRNNGSDLLHSKLPILIPVDSQSPAQMAIFTIVRATKILAKARVTPNLI